MNIKEVPLDEAVAETLIALSADWEAENSCYGYRKNGPSDLEGNRVFLAEEDGEIIGYLLGTMVTSKEYRSIMPAGTDYFEIEELYVKPEFRSQGVGSSLFRYVEAQVRPEATYIMLSTATKNFRAILHFYIDEVGMEFWSAQLFKKLQ